MARREWRIWTRGGARQEKPCRFGRGVLRMWNVECEMLDVGCEMLDVEFGMGHAAREYSPTDHADFHRNHAG